jgi:hypothetical protein
MRLTASRIAPSLGADDKEEEKGNGQPGVNPLPEKGKTVNGKYQFSEQERQWFRDDPECFLAYRRKLEATLNSMFDMYLYINKSETSIKAKGAKFEMLRRIGPGHEELKESSFRVGHLDVSQHLIPCIENVLMWPRSTDYAWGRMLEGSGERK